jgi:hypothetical protein
MRGGGQKCLLDTDKACTYSFNFYQNFSNLFLVIAVWCQLLPKFLFEKLRMIEIGPRGRWKRSSIFQTSHPSQKDKLFKALSLWKKNSIGQIFHQKKFQKVLIKIEEMADVFLNSANFAKHTFSTLVPPRGYALNLKALIKVSKVS